MKNQTRLLLFSLFILLFTSLVGQDTTSFLLMGGQEFEGIIEDQNEEVLWVKIRTKKGNEKQMILPKERIFSSVTNGKETIWYSSDSSDEHQYSVEEMRYYIFGQQDAREKYKPLLPMLVGAGVSAAIAFYAGTHESALVLLGPLGGTIVGTVAQSNKPKPKDARSDRVLAQPAYVEGFRKGARGKKIIRTIGSSIVGMVVGGVAGFVVANQ